MITFFFNQCLNTFILITEHNYSCLYTYKHLGLRISRLMKGNPNKAYELITINLQLQYMLQNLNLKIISRIAIRMLTDVQILRIVHTEKLYISLQRRAIIYLF